MLFIDKLSIGRKLRWMTLLTSAVSLLLIGACFVVYDLATFRRTVASETTILADVLGKNSQAALAFSDARAGAEILTALQAEPHIMRACFFTPTGMLFATFLRPSPQSQFPRYSEITTESRFTADRLIIMRPIVRDGELLGSIYLESDLQMIQEHLWKDTAIVAGALLLSLFVAFLIGNRLQRLISVPLTQLAQAARKISDEKDYSIRAKGGGRDEIGQLIKGFNEMLEQVHLRDEALRRHRDTLEEEVVHRTEDLRTLVSQLMAARDKAEESSRVKSQFLANVSHEIRTPMNGIIGMTDLVLGTALTQEQREYLEIVKSSSESLLLLIVSLWDLKSLAFRRQLVV